MKKSSLKVSAIICQHCGDTVYSRSDHDFRFCTCGKVAIDGGRNYTKIVGNVDDYKQTIVEVLATAKQLHDDWNFGMDKLGIIKKLPKIYIKKELSKIDKFEKRSIKESSKSVIKIK